MKSKSLTWASLERTRTIWKGLLERYWVWAILFAAAVVLLNMPSLGIRWQDMREGEVSTEDIVLPIDIQVEDVEATEARLEEARKSVKPVFDYNPFMASSIVDHISTFFSLNRAELSRGAEPIRGGGDIVLKDDTFAFCVEKKFSQDLEETLNALIPKIYRNPIVANKIFLMSLHSTGYVEQTITSSRETETFDVFNPKGYPEEVEEFLLTELQAVRGYTRKDKGLMKQLLLDNIQPNLTYNALETQRRREAAASRIHTIVRNYPAGSILVRRGERFEREDLQVLEVLRQQQRMGTHWTHQIGVFFYALLAIIFFIVVVRLRKVTLYGQSPDMTLGVTFILSILFLCLVKVLAAFGVRLSLSFTSFPFDQKTLYLYAIPFPLGAFIIQLLSGYPLVVAFSLVFAHFASMIAGNYSIFFPYVLAGSLAVAISLQRIRTRSDVTKAGILAGGVNVMIVVIQALTSQTVSGVSSLFFTILFAFGGGILTAILVSFLSPIIETIFGVTTDLRLMELSNATHPVLRQLAISAPGTYIHSFNMALLAERAAEIIGANPLIVRVACLFHDIGKIKQPQYFIENQKGDNPHHQLQPGMSRMVLRNHVLKGVEIAKQYRLPQVVIDAIRQHHGKKLMTYFYEAAKEREQSSVEDTDYRYPGPTPQTKEMGILLLADAVEASARSLDEPSPGKFRNVVQTIIQRSIEDGQLVECPITLDDMRQITQSFSETLTSMHHNRIAYPGYSFDEDQKEKEQNGNHSTEAKTLQDPESR